MNVAVDALKKMSMVVDRPDIAVTRDRRHRQTSTIDRLNALIDSQSDSILEGDITLWSAISDVDTDQFDFSFTDVMLTDSCSHNLVSPTAKEINIWLEI